MVWFGFAVFWQREREEGRRKGRREREQEFVWVWRCGRSGKLGEAERI